MQNCEHKILSGDLSKKLFKHRTPLSGGIELTSQCNFKCIHCYETIERDSDSNYFSTQKLIEVIDKFVSLGMMSVFLTGGEAMLRPDFDYIYKHLRESGVLVAVLSNGTAITKEKCELFKEYSPSMIDISIYGASEETYRAITQKEGMFNRFLKGIKLLKEYNIPFQLKSVIMKENVNDLEKMKDIADSFCVPFKYFSYIRPFNNGNREPQCHMLTHEQILGIEHNDTAMCEYYCSKSINELSDRQKNKNTYLCRIAQNGFFITYDGVLNGCVRARSSGMSLNEYSVEEGWEYLYDQYVMSREEKSFPCAECKIINFCDFCPGEFEIETGKPTIPPPEICKLAHKRAKMFKGI